MDDSHRAQYEQEGFCILRGAIPAPLLGRLNDVFSREIDNHLSARPRPRPHRSSWRVP